MIMKAEKSHDPRLQTGVPRKLGRQRKSRQGTQEHQGLREGGDGCPSSRRERELTLPLPFGFVGALHGWDDVRLPC